MADSLAVYLSKQLGLSDERREVVAFGALALLQNGTSAAVLLLLAYLTGVLPEALAALVTAGILRHATGGVHLQTPWRCVGATALAFWAAGYLGHLLVAAHLTTTMSLALILPVAVAGLLVIFLRAPVEAENRPLSPEHKVYLRRLSRQFGWMVAVLLVVGALLDTWWWAPGLLGYFVQCTTLTPPGHKLAGMIDHAFNQLQRR